MAEHETPGRCCPNADCRQEAPEGETVCPRCGTPLVTDERPCLEITIGRGRRVRGLLGYGLFFGVVAGVLVYLLAVVGGSMPMALGLVAFMVVYMAAMGVMAWRTLSGKK